MPAQQIYLVIGLGLFFMLFVLELIRRHKLRERDSLLWMFISLSILSIPLLFEQYLSIACFFGIRDSTSFFVATAISFLILLCIQFSLEISAIRASNKSLAQSAALLEDRVRELENSSK